ncbi:MAG: SusC/RagA family TonB-linked outer membrane protein [Sphingobacteriaceae bacterium]|nr:MAG: SusC/RagA family TonB-linked outer membrane protein [Sphingobacteriaceae bacterium]
MKKSLLFYRFYGLMAGGALCTALALGTVSPVQAKAPVKTNLKYQAFTLTGVITDEKNEPMPGVTVTNVTQNKSVASNGNGAFSIEANKGDVIRFKMIGYAETTIIANDAQTNVTVKLKVENVELQETVVTALGIKREQRSLGYAVGEVDGNGLKKARETNVINSLAGRVPGLIINSTAGGPAGSSRVIIRGNTTITGNNQPLYVVDGIPIDNSNYGGTGSGTYAGGVDMGDAISAINPDDIDKISVLKGSAATALYGSRAGAGVILITTKKGNASKQLGVEVNSTASFEDQLTSFDGYQYLYGQGTKQIINTSADQARTTLFQNFGARLDPDLQVIGYDGVARPYALVKDNISGFFRTGNTFTNTVSLTNSTDVSSFRFGATNMHNNDIIPASGINRNSFTFNGTSKLGSKLSVEARAFYMNEKVNNRPQLADDPGNIGNAFIGLANNVDQSLFANTYKNAQGDYLEWGGGQYRLNPYWVINEMENTTQKNRFLGAVQLNYNPLSWLNMQGRVSTDVTNFDYQKFSPRTTPGAISGMLDMINSRNTTTEADVLVTAQKQVSKDWNLSLRLGGSISRAGRAGTTSQFLNMSATDIVTPTAFTDQAVVALRPMKRHLNAAYALFSAGFKSYLYVDASVRQDASSTLPIDNNAYTYPSVSTSFIFTDAFNISNKILSFGKLRISAAQVGNDTNPYLMDQYYNINSLPFNGGALGYIDNETRPNNKIKPPLTNSFEIGTELKFLGDRIGLDFTYYTQKTKNQINIVPIPITSGYKNDLVNAGTIANHGFEVLLTGKPIVSKDFNWDVSFNFARNVNNVESLAAGIPFLSLSDARWLGVSVVAQPGAPFGSILAYNYQKDTDGNIILDPVTLNPVLSNTRELLGKGVFDWTGGFSSTINYKAFTLTTLIDVKVGADLFSMTNLFATIRGSMASTLEGRAEWIKSEEDRQAGGYTFDQWNAMGNVRGYVPKGVVQTGTDGDGNPIYTENTRALDPSVYWAASYSDGNGIAVPYLYDASYVKMREITFGYRLPSLLTKKLGAKDIQVAFVARNPFIIHKNVPNVDPDSNYNNGNGQGFEYGSLPGRRSWGFNLNFRF